MTEEGQKSDDMQRETERTFWAAHRPKFRYGEKVHYLKKFVAHNETQDPVATVQSIGSDGLQFLYNIEFVKTHYNLCDVKESDLRQHKDGEFAARARAERASDFWRTAKRRFCIGERIVLVSAVGAPLKYGSIQAFHETSHERSFAKEFHYGVQYDDNSYDNYEAERNLQRLY